MKKDRQMFTVHAFNIKYRDNKKIISVTGPEMLKNYNEGILTVYDAKSAPTELTIEVEMLYEDFETSSCWDVICAKLEEETGLEITSFGYMIL